MVKSLLRSVYAITALVILYTNQANATASEGHLFFYGRIFKNQQEIWDQQLMMELKKLPLDPLRYFNENRTACIVNEQQEVLYTLELTSLQELKDEFDRPLPAVYPKPETDKQAITILQKADGGLSLNIR